MTEWNVKGKKRRGSDYLYETLVDAGIELLVELPGTQTLPVDRTVAERNEMQYVMARHETSIPHIAWDTMNLEAKHGYSNNSRTW